MRAESISSTPAEQSSTLPESGGASDQSPDSVQTQNEVAAAVIEEAEILHVSVKAGSVAQVVVAAIAVLGLIYLLKLVLVTTLSAALLAFILEPLVGRLTRIGIPRAIAALAAVVLMVTVAAGNDPQFHHCQSERRVAECHHQYGCVLAVGYPVLLFSWRNQRIRWPKSLPRRFPGSAASSRRRRWRRGQSGSSVHLCHGHRAAHGHHECALSEDRGKARTTEPVGCEPCHCCFGLGFGEPWASCWPCHS
jgi:hypothetical protein